MLKVLDNFHYTFAHHDEPIEDRETEYVGLILEDRTIVIESFDVDDNVEQTLSKINDKKVIGFIHGLDDEDVRHTEILDAFDRGFKTYEEYCDYLDYISDGWKEAGEP